MRRKRVLIINDGKLLATGVASLLDAEPNVEVIMVDPAGTDVLAKVRRSRADVIVVPSDNGAASHARVAQILSQNAGARVIAFGLDQTKINVYRSERVAEASLEELLSAIKQGG